VNNNNQKREGVDNDVKKDCEHLPALLYACPHVGGLRERSGSCDVGFCCILTVGLGRLEKLADTSRL
jgi:hypothetical protein